MAAICVTGCNGCYGLQNTPPLAKEREGWGRQHFLIAFLLFHIFHNNIYKVLMSTVKFAVL
jgi:hypothetical protein